METRVLLDHYFVSNDYHKHAEQLSLGAVSVLYNQDFFQELMMMKYHHMGTQPIMIDHLFGVFLKRWTG